ncbi:MAG: outer membrane protein transport protein, partial [Bacteroidetes bacterium]|nr:outer membrane protein transport protein [Bacteroidota bacterium]
VKDNFITTDMPDADKYVFGLGLGYSWKSGFTLECSYQFETKRERQGQNSDTQLDGSYSSIMHGAGLGISYKF